MTWKPMSEPHGAVSNGAPSASNEAKREADQKRKGGLDHDKAQQTAAVTATASASAATR